MAASTAMLPVPDRTRASTNEAGCGPAPIGKGPGHADVDDESPAHRSGEPAR